MDFFKISKTRLFGDVLLLIKTNPTQEATDAKVISYENIFALKTFLNDTKTWVVVK